MVRKIDEAYVQILPDFSSFGAVASKQITGALQGVSQTVNRAAQQIDNNFTHAATSVHESFADISTAANHSFVAIEGAASSAATEVADSFVGASHTSEEAFQGFQTSATRDLDQLDRRVRTSASTMGSSFGTAGIALKAGLAAGVLAVGAGLVKLTTSGLQSAASLEQTNISFQALTGSADAATKLFNQLQQFAAATPFNFPDIANAAKRFLAFHDAVGLTASGLQDYLTTVGNVISVTGGGADAFGRINLAIGQIGSASKVTLDNLNQIADAIPGFSPISAIARNLGVTTAQAMQMVSSGGISAAQGVQALLKGMQQFPGAAGAMEKQSQTLLGVFSTFQDTVGQALSKAFAPAIPAIKATLTQITPVIGDALSIIGPALGNVLSGALPLLGAIVKGVVPILAPILNALGPALTQLAPVVEPLGDALAKIIIPLIPAIPLVTQLALIILQIVVPALQLLSVILRPLAPVLSFMAKAVGEFAEAIDRINWGSVGKAIGGAFSKAWTAVSNFFKMVGAFFAKLPGQMLKALVAIPGLILKFFIFMFDTWLQAIGVGIGAIIALFTKFPGLALNAVLNFATEFVQWMDKVWTAVEDKAIERAAQLITFFASLPAKMVSAVAALPKELGDFFQGVWNHLEQKAEDAVFHIIQFFRDLPHHLTGFASEIGHGIVNFLKDFLNHAIDDINSGIAKIDDVVPGDLPRIPRLARGGIAFGPALIGENSNTAPEAAIPLGDARALAMLRNALGGTGTTINFASGAVIVNVNGSVTPQQAQAIGQQVGQGIANTLAKNNIRMAVRTA